MQQFLSFFLSWRLFTAQHVSGVYPPIIRSLMNAVVASGFTFVSWWQSCCVRGRAGPARPRTQYDCHHDTEVKPESATAVIELLIMGGKTPETCWSVNKRQDKKNWKIVASGWWFIWIVLLWCLDRFARSYFRHISLQSWIIQCRMVPEGLNFMPPFFVLVSVVRDME